MNSRQQIPELAIAMEQLDLVCFSHLRWNFVYQRPQHLMSRSAKVFRTFLIEEPVFTQGKERIEYNYTEGNIGVVTPCLNRDISEDKVPDRMTNLLLEFFRQKSILHYIFWYYTPMALEFTEKFQPELIIYDCMDELSAFKFAPSRLKELEKRLFNKADLVFTGGFSLYEHKKNQHKNIYPFPSSIDKQHFAQARMIRLDPPDQEKIPHPRLGYSGVIDERFDIGLISRIAELKKDWHFVIVGPAVKIDPASLPQRPNIHYLGGKTYEELPFYIGGWDIAVIPFARNESTLFISPTKTPEYLAAGKPVISTSIKDVVDPYGRNGLVYIADDPESFIAAAKNIFLNPTDSKWLNEVDSFLAGNSWDKTWTSMLQLIKMTIEEKKNLNNKKKLQANV